MFLDAGIATVRMTQQAMGSGGAYGEGGTIAAMTRWRR